MTRTQLLLCLMPAALLMAAGAGCVRKTFAVQSDPPGATVFVDGEEIGRTPIHNIQWFFDGTREIAVTKAGYLTERRIVKMRASWFSWFPFDIISELIIPWDIYDRRYYYFALKPIDHIEEATLLRHAADTRLIARERIETARRSSTYQPRAYVVEGEHKKSVIFGPFISPPRVVPRYLGETQRKPAPENAK